MPKHLHRLQSQSCQSPRVTPGGLSEHLVGLPCISYHPQLRPRRLPNKENTDLTCWLSSESEAPNLCKSLHQTVISFPIVLQLGVPIGNNFFIVTQNPLASTSALNSPPENDGRQQEARVPTVDTHDSP